ncbi:MAG TPA: DUF2306 domain-containing protein [Glycomyces sp.]|nr:DUF2306 domain-containing protein [Glycomyces sp.]
MHASSAHAAPPPSGRRGRLALILAAVLSAGIALYAVPPYLLPGVEPRIEIREDLAVHLPLLVVHAATGGIALLLGPLQFSGGVRRRHPGVHRLIGRAYLLVGVLPSALTGILVAALSLAGPLAMAAFIVLDILWLHSARRAYSAARERDFAAHERWMLRNMAFTFAAVTLRACLGLYIAAQLPLLQSAYGGEFERLFAVAYTAAAVSSVAFNWLFIEIYLRRKGSHGNVAVVKRTPEVEAPM